MDGQSDITELVVALHNLAKASDSKLTRRMQAKLCQLQITQETA